MQVVIGEIAIFGKIELVLQVWEGEGWEGVEIQVLVLARGSVGAVEEVARG
jgi:hypothetical protein